MRRSTIFLLTVALLFTIPFYLSGCSGKESAERLKEAGKPAGGGRGTVDTTGTTPEVSGPEGVVEATRATKLHIEPENPKRGDQLMAMMMESKGKAYYQWYVNGELLKEGNESTLSTEGLERGDSVMVKVKTREGEFVSEPVTIVNAPPVIRKALLLPVSPKRGDILRVEVEAEDPDGDDFSLRYEWSINGVPAGTDSETLQADIKRGDNVIVRITPVDAEYAEGRTVERSVTIGNAPPVVEGGIKGLRVENGRLTGRIVVTDPDGDDVMFSIVNAPEGLEIDDSGNISWTLPPSAVGTHTISVKVSDGYGGESLFNFELSLTPRKG
jgi:hypothetical protein